MNLAATWNSLKRNFLGWKLRLPYDLRIPWVKSRQELLKMLLTARAREETTAKNDLGKASL